MTSSSTDNNETRRFGIVAFFFFGCIFALGLYTKKVIPTYLFGFLSIVGFSLILVPIKTRLWCLVENRPPLGKDSNCSNAHSRLLSGHHPRRFHKVAP
jgi:hypothetical protein